MNGKKKLFIGIAIFLVLGLALFFWLFSRNRSSSIVQPNPISNQNQNANSFPVIHGEKPSDSTDTFDITTQKASVTVNNIYKLPDAKPLSLDGVNFKNSQYYYIAYYPKQQGFIIAIMDPDLQKARGIAENDFLEVLGINKDQACQLNVSLTVPPDVNERASGGNYGLSFCPNGKPFPK